MPPDGPSSRADDERRVREHLYGGRDRPRPRLDPGPVDIVAAEDPGVEAAMVASESAEARRGRLARSTALFSVATSLSRIAGLVREIVAAAYFGVSGAMSAFTIAFQVPNLVRSLFADAAIQAAFVPVFTEHLQKREFKEAFRLASTLIFLVGLVLTGITAFFVLIAPYLMPLFVGSDVPQHLTVTLSQIQLAIPTWDLRNTPFKLAWEFAWRNPDVRRVLLLMLPVTLSLGLINFNLLINSIFGSLLSESAPAAIDKAFRIYMLPQGIFSVAVTTVIFPTLARLASRGEYDDLRATMANGMRQIVLLLVPAAAAILVLSTPMIRLVYQHGDFGPHATDLVSTALFWFAFSLPFNGLFLLLTRTFFSLQRPWVPTAISGVNLAITAVAAAALYSPFGIGGIVAATVIATAVSVFAQTAVLRRQLGRLELGRLTWTTARVCAAAAALAGVSYGVWYILDQALGRGLAAQIVSLGAALGTGALVYAAAITAFRIPEAHQIWRLLRRRA